MIIAISTSRYPFLDIYCFLKPLPALPPPPKKKQNKKTKTKKKQKKKHKQQYYYKLSPVHVQYIQK